MNKCSILYVDDEKENLVSFKSLFGRYFSIQIALGGREALDLLQTESFQIMISDQNMPDMSGIQLVKEVSRLYPDIIKILLTGYTDLETVLEAINQGQIYRYISKPFQEEAMLVTLKNASELYILKMQNKELLSNLIETNKQLNQLNEELEKKVQERIEHLSHALSEIKKLKMQQDGDYYLTSLLIEPLGRNTVSTSKVTVESFIQQKKEFYFKERGRAIGGDINIAHNIILLDKPYTVFVNADAMGKSTQGAGGALVFGTAFEVIMERVRSFKWGKNLMPDEWIYNTYQELNRSFQYFEGLMMVSMNLGIIEEDTGKFFFIVAEHPFPALLREGKASFLCNEQNYYKLGFPNMDLGKKKISIHFTQLQPGDIVFFGSDGKDDVLVKNEEGNLKMNEDQTRFLDCIQKSEGDLQKLYAEISNNSQITDDLSLIKAHYIGS